MESRRFILPPRTAHVWFADLAELSGSLDLLRPLLSDDERLRAERFTMERQRQRFILRRGLLRILLGRYAGRPPEELRFVYGSHGKPELPGGPAFNLTDSEDSVAIAIAAEGAIGADIERIRPIEGAEGLAEQFFSPAEVAALRALPAGERNAAFLSCWVCKEAFVKAAGAGLSLPLDLFTVEVRSGRPAAVLAIDETLQPNVGSAQEWSLFQLSGLPDSIAVVAIRGTGWQVEGVLVTSAMLGATGL